MIKFHLWYLEWYHYSIKTLFVIYLRKTKDYKLSKLFFSSYNIASFVLKHFFIIRNLIANRHQTVMLNLLLRSWLKTSAFGTMDKKRPQLHNYIKYSIMTRKIAFMNTIYETRHLLLTVFIFQSVYSCLCIIS